MTFFARLLLTLVLSFTFVQLPMTRAHAEDQMISTREFVEEMNRTEAQNKIAEFINREGVKDQLVKMGMSPDEATRRLASLSDQETQELANDIAHATLGGSIGGLLVLVVLVLLIIYLAKRI